MEKSLINGNQAIDLLSGLDKAQSELTKGMGRVADIQENYSLWMCHNFTVLNEGCDRASYTLAKYASGEGVAIHWFDRTGNSAKPVKARRDSYKSDMESVVDAQGVHRFSENNIDKIWSRIKELSGKGSASKESDTDKSIDTVNLKELATILRRIQKGEKGAEYMPKSIKALSSLETAYESLGGKLSDVYKD